MHEFGAAHNGVDGAGLLAVPAVDALGHVDVVASGAASAVGSLLGLDGDGLRRADGLAQLARDAALLAGRVSPKRVLAPKPGAERPLFKRVVQRRLGFGEILEAEAEAFEAPTETKDK